MAVILVTILVSFSPALFSDRSFAFRDAAHFYAPLFRWIQAEWGAGRIPLWNPLDDLGTPVAADVTSSVFYPGKLVFALPISFATAFKLFIVGHVLLAGITMYVAARSWRRGYPAATLAALAYAMGGNVLFQYCNCPYLVGAAWMPLAVASLPGTFQKKNGAGPWTLSVAMSLMILGGDPQAAYHTILLLVTYWLMYQWRRAWRDMDGWRVILKILTVAALLSAVQWVPSAEWAKASERYRADHPRTVYELVGGLAEKHQECREHETCQHPWHHGIVGNPTPNTHEHGIYSFSVGYWRWPELLWPNLSGQTFPVHTRWLKIIPAEGRAWTPSLYMGLLPVVLAITQFRFRRGQRRRRWLTGVVLLAALGGAGIYGGGWLCREFAYGVWGQPHTPDVGPQAGGVYWWMTVFLPNYVLFRYPAKLWCVAALAISLLASFGCDDLLRGPRRAPLKTLGVLLGTSLLMVGLLWFLKDQWTEWLSSVPADRLFGPLDVAKSRDSLLGSFFHTGLVSGVLGICCWLYQPDRKAARERSIAVDSADESQSKAPSRGSKNDCATLGSRRWFGGPSSFGMLLVIVTAADLLVSQRPLLELAPQATWETTSSHGAIGAREPWRVYRIRSLDWYPSCWSATNSADRLQACIARDVTTLAPRYHLLQQQPILGASHSLQPLVLAELMRLLEPVGGLTASQLQALRNLGVRSVYGPQSVGDHSQSLEGSLPRAWIADRIMLSDSPTPRTPAQIHRELERLFFRDGDQTNFRQLSTVALSTVESPRLRKELHDLATTNLHGSTAESRASERCEITHDDPQRVELEVELRKPGVVVLADLDWPGWQASVVHGNVHKPSQLEVFRVNGLMRGVSLGAGQHRVRFIYRPWRCYLAAATSGLAWTGVWLLGSLNLIVRFRRQLIGPVGAHS